MEKTTVKTAETTTMTTKMNQEIIKTSLMGKEEAFKMLAIARLMGTAILFIGEKGVNVN